MAVSGLSPEKQVKQLLAHGHTAWQAPHCCHVAEGSEATITRLHVDWWGENLMNWIFQLCDVHLLPWEVRSTGCNDTSL